MYYRLGLSSCAAQGVPPYLDSIGIFFANSKVSYFIQSSIMSSLLKAMTMRCKALEIRCEPGRYTDTISHSAARNFEGKAEQDWYMPAAYVAELREMTARPAIKAGKIHERS